MIENSLEILLTLSYGGKKMKMRRMDSGSRRTLEILSLSSPW
jgi:hypothetical protein